MPAARLLVVEDEAKLAANLKRGLGEAGFAVDLAPSAKAARESLSHNGYDLTLLDLRSPGQVGLEFLAELRAAGAVLPVLILTARDSTDELVRGLDTGGDDCLTKPFAFDELLARVGACSAAGWRPTAPCWKRAPSQSTLRADWLRAAAACWICRPRS